MENENENQTNNCKWTWLFASKKYCSWGELGDYGNFLIEDYYRRIIGEIMGEIM